LPPGHRSHHAVDRGTRNEPCGRSFSLAERTASIGACFFVRFSSSLRSPLPAARTRSAPPLADAALLRRARGFVAALAVGRLCVIGRRHRGLVAQRFAIDHPNRVSALVLYGASSRGDQEFFGAFLKSIERSGARPWFAEASTTLLKDGPRSSS